MVQILFILLVLTDLLIELAFPLLKISGSLLDLFIDIFCQILQLFLDLSDLLGLKPTQFMVLLIIMSFQLLLQIGLRLLQRDDLFLLFNKKLILSLHLKLH